MKFCSKCGAELLDEAVICPKCGCACENTASTGTGIPGTYLNGQDKITMILICLFLGGIGIHNFMMGESKKGIFKIIMCLCFGISYIFALIDLVKICTDKYVVDPNKLI